MTEILRINGLRLATVEPTGVAADSVLFVVDEPSDGVHVVPLLHALRRQSHVAPVVVFTCPIARQAFEELATMGSVRLRPDHRTLDLPGHDATERTSVALRAFGALLDEDLPAVVVLAGAGDATLAAALAAAKAGVPILRLDGGLRTGDWSRADEINRTLIDRLADTLLVSGPAEVRVLEGEGTSNGRVHEVGNLAVDLLDRWRSRAGDRAVWNRLGVRPDEYAVVMLERRENLTDERRLTAIAEALAVTARTHPVLFVMPAWAEAQLRRESRPEQLRALGVACVGPFGYVDLLSLKSRAAGVITDSVVVQDELTALGRRSFTLANTAERLATVTDGTNLLVGDDPADLAFVEFDPLGALPEAVDPIPLWDGCTAIRAADILVSNYIFARATGVEA
ncbi:MAG TPA: UDP-N-acetylglucosamine 2-epimerase [Baekduia sp.]|nr:UDP-N-acetylglucosamine 2-epimerase [Baekduia sp.]